MARTLKAAAGIVASLALALAAGPVSAVETSSLTVDGITVSGGTLSVTGTAVFGDDLLGPVEVWSDSEGDAAASGAGLDIAAGTIATDLASRKLVFTMSTVDGQPAPVDGSPPLTGFMWPISANGENWFRWLGAGTQGAATSPSKFTALCENENEAEGGSGGWSCATTIPGSLTQDGITWNLQFSRMKPALDVGSTVEAGGILCNVPCSMTWPTQVVGALTPVDTAGFPETYVIPGRIRLGVAPAGTPESQVTYSATGALNATADGFTGSLSAPQSPGTYTLFVKTCGGLQPSQTCVIGSSDFTVG